MLFLQTIISRIKDYFFNPTVPIPPIENKKQVINIDKKTPVKFFYISDENIEDILFVN